MLGVNVSTVFFLLFCWLFCLLFWELFLLYAEETGRLIGLGDRLAGLEERVEGIISPRERLLSAECIEEDCCELEENIWLPNVDYKWSDTRRRSDVANLLALVA